jgi:hypothetical protein
MNMLYTGEQFEWAISAVVSDGGCDPSLTSRIHPEPAANDHGPNHRITNCKDPWWRLIVQNGF